MSAVIPSLSLTDGVVEIVGDNGAHYLAYVVDLDNQKGSDKSLEAPLITLRFEKDWRKRETFPLSRIRLLPKISRHKSAKSYGTQSKHQMLTEGSEAEVWKAKKEGHECGFWKCVIKMVKDDFYGVSYGSDDSLHCKVDDKEFHEIVTRDKIRPINGNQYLTRNPFFKFVVDVPKELLAMNPKLFKSHETHKHFKNALSLIAVNYDDRTNRLVCIGFSDKDKDRARQTTVKGAELLADMHFRAVKLVIEMRTDISVFSQQFKNLDEIFKIKENEFEMLVRVEEQFMKYAIGMNGSNIKKVLQMPGILSVDRVAGVGENVFKVVATNRNCLRVAKEVLQISELVVNIPRDLVPHIIGRGGALVQEMTDKSGLISIKVKGDDPNEKPKHSVPFHLIGTKEALENADILIRFQMNCIKENLEFDKKFSPKRTDKRRSQ